MLPFKLILFTQLSLKPFCVNCRGEFFQFSGKDDSPPTVERRVWERRNFHFDNVMGAMLTLFAVQTSEGWPQ